MKFYGLLITAIFVFILGQSASVYAQCPEQLSYEIVTPAQCGGATGTIKVIVPANVDITNNNFTLETPEGVFIRGEMGDANISGVPALANGKIHNSNTLTCDGAPFNPPLITNVKTYGTHIVKESTYAFVCQNSTDAKIHVLAAGGSGKYRYSLWDSTTELEAKTVTDGSKVVFTAAIKGKYTVKVYDENCKEPSEVSYEVKVQKHSIGEKLIKGPDKVCPGSPFTLSTEVVAESYKWTYKVSGNEVSDTKDFHVAAANVNDNEGKYKLEVTLGNNECIYADSIILTVGAIDALKAKTVNLCKNTTGNGTEGKHNIEDSVSATSPTYVLKWYDMFGTSIPTPEVDARFVGITEYQVAQEDALGKCLSDKTTITVAVNDLPKQIDANTITICVDPLNPVKTIIIHPAGNGNEYSIYDAETGGNRLGYATGVNDTAKITTNEPLANGSYFFETLVGNCASPRAKRDILRPDKIITGNTDLCLGSTLQLISTFKGSIVWTTPNNIPVSGNPLKIDNVTFRDAGVYKLTVTPYAGCVMNDTVRVKVTSTSTPVVSNTKYDYCLNQTADPLEATQTGNTLIWYLNGSPIMSGGSPVQAPVPSTATAGTFKYYVSQKDAKGCESDKVEVEVIVTPPPPPILASDLSYCVGTTPVIKIASTNELIYKLYNSASELVSQKIGNGGIISINGLPETANTTYSVTVSTKGGCESQATSINIISDNNVIDNASTSSVCEGKTITLKAATIPGATYSWALAGDVYSTQIVNLPNATQANAGTYTLTVKKEGCTDIVKTFTVTVGKPSVPTGPPLFEYCKNETATPLTATSSPGNVLIWYDGAGNKLPAAPTPSTIAEGTVMYKVAQAVQNDLTCISDTRDIAVTTHGLPDAPAVQSPIAICAATSPTISINNSIAGYKYILYDAANAKLGENTGNGATVQITTSVMLNSSVVYSVEVISNKGCVSKRSNVNIDVAQLVIAPDKLPSYKKNEYYEQQLTTNASAPVFTYIGSLPSGITMSGEGLISGTPVNMAGTEFTVKVTDNAGCFVEKNYKLDGTIIIVDVFTPNGDGINDYFMKGYKVAVFDRYGVKIYEGTDGWDGTRKGSAMPSDIYYYILEYADDSGQIQKVSGSVMSLKRN